MNKEYQFEKVTYEPSPQNNGEFLPHITIGESKPRPFHPSDMERVLDYDNMPEPPPPDAPHGHHEFEMDDDNMTIRDEAPPKFPKRFFCLRGSFIFYYDGKDVDMNYDKTTFDRHDAKFHAVPLGVIPLERTAVEFPPGGRRVFREHANTEASNGYEMKIRHVARVSHKEKDPTSGAADTDDKDKDPTTGAVGAASVLTKRRAPAYLVMDSLGQRDAWANAIRFRADVYMKDTKLRPAGTAPDPTAGSSMGMGDALNLDAAEASHHQGGKKGAPSPSRRVGGEISVLAGVIKTEEQKDIDKALQTFGTRTLFQEDDWVNEFFETHDEYQCADMCQKLERWQTSIKKGLRGAVLEQYEYFVEASREMTIMGREVASLKDLVTKQVETFESMKRVTFDLDFGEGPPNGDDADGTGTEDDTTRYSSDEEDRDGDEHKSYKSPVSKKKFFGRFRRGEATSPLSGRSNKSSSTIDIPKWLDDVVEEITAFVKECRYTDATELLIKAKTEVSDIVNLNEKLTEKKLSKKEVASMQRILISIEDLTKRLCERLSEGLRRKNEALKQTTKKERADPLSAMAPLVSPIALNDDATALHLLVRLGRPQDAASAYATRRSLLLNECLHERPICNTNTANNMDIVIYAAQLSHSFFNALAMAVEGFLDLFSDHEKLGLQDDHSESSSINTGSNLSNIPSNALAATCLWCDSELSKFAAVFGSKILGNLMLSPREGGMSNKISDQINKFETVADLSHLKQQLRAAEEMGEYAAAGKLRKKIAIQEQEEKNGKGGGLQGPPSKKSNDKDRKLAIEIASKCIDQAFSFASESLNTIGLPLTPRLAEYLRTRLKGTEAEIAIELEDKWDMIIFDWKSGSVGIEIRPSTSAG